MGMGMKTWQWRKMRYDDEDLQRARKRQIGVATQPVLAIQCIVWLSCNGASSNAAHVFAIPPPKSNPSQIRLSAMRHSPKVAAHDVGRRFNSLARAAREAKEIQARVF